MKRRVLSIFIALTIVLMSSITAFASEEAVGDGIAPFAEHTLFLATDEYTELETVTVRLLKTITITNSALNGAPMTIVVLDDANGYILEPTFLLPGDSKTVVVLANQSPATVYAKAIIEDGPFTVTVSNVGL